MYYDYIAKTRNSLYHIWVGGEGDRVKIRHIWGKDRIEVGADFDVLGLVQKGIFSSDKVVEQMKDPDRFLKQLEKAHGVGLGIRYTDHEREGDTSPIIDLYKVVR